MSIKWKQLSLSHVPSGNPQRSVLGPLLFLLHTILHTHKKVKGSSYVAQYPVLRTAQSALHFTCLTDLFTQTPSRLLWEASIWCSDPLLALLLSHGQCIKSLNLYENNNFKCGYFCLTFHWPVLISVWLPNKRAFPESYICCRADFVFCCQSTFSKFLLLLVLVWLPAYVTPRCNQRRWSTQGIWLKYVISSKHNYWCYSVVCSNRVHVICYFHSP